MQEQFPGQEFPGDDPANYLNRVPYEAPFDLARSPGKVLDELGHEFRVRVSLSPASLSFSYSFQNWLNYSAFLQYLGWNQWIRPS